jgi:nitronate monooxygenase
MPVELPELPYPAHEATPQPEPMAPEELGSLLNVLLEAERAGAKLLAAYLSELTPQAAAWALLHRIQRDEAHNCVVLIHYLLEAGTLPSTQTGDFYRKGLAIEGWRERLHFLNRGQAWVASRIAAALPHIAQSDAKEALQGMYDSHLANIGSCERVLD